MQFKENFFYGTLFWCEQQPPIIQLPSSSRYLTLTSTHPTPGGYLHSKIWNNLTMQIVKFFTDKQNFSQNSHILANFSQFQWLIYF